MSRPVRSQDLKLIDAVIQYVRECQAGMLGLSATPMEISPGGKPQVGNGMAEYVAQFCLCGRRVFYGRRLEVFNRFYAVLPDLDDYKAELIVMAELQMEWGSFEWHRKEIEGSRKFADELRAHQMLRSWMREEEEESTLQEEEELMREAKAKEQFTRIGFRGESNRMAKLTSADAENIRRHVRRGCAPHQMAVLYNVADSTISRIVRGETWR